MKEDGSAASRACRYALKPTRVSNEDILICVDVDAASTMEMKTTGSNGKPLMRLDCIKQAILLFVNCKLSINPDHRFAFATLSESATWLKKDFTSDVESAASALRGLSAVTSSCGQADLTLLFQLAAHEARKSRAQDRILRLVVVYCRPSVKPTHDWPVNQKLFTLDVMHLHDKPCEEVYGSLVDTVRRVSEYKGYIFDSGQGLARSVFESMSVLLSHPQQRCAQDDLDTPKPLIAHRYMKDSRTSEKNGKPTRVRERRSVRERRRPRSVQVLPGPRGLAKVRGCVMFYVYRYWFLGVLLLLLGRELRNKWA
ncbi:PREDICTED: BRISC and BRCA1-A complex member 1-like [Tarenaya hassleriana]|uniref:BRISC and BRCA1-A complex member 1-like n=1 Tax=Tarenaya hassleriana TaxID=28532 RepID=UPI00053C9FE1|nr:PREDICTED: BRISC and BRCA1-A complex member 1-like [Tarenaya hassleriana]